MSMSEERRQYLSEFHKKRWAEAESIAEMLGNGTTKHDVYYILRYIDSSVLVSALAGNKDGLNAVRKVVERSKNFTEVEIAEEKPKSAAAYLNMALWFIRQVGDPDKALAVMTTAVSAFKSLSEKDATQ